MKVMYVLGVRTSLEKGVHIEEIMLNRKLFKFFKALKYHDHIEICTMRKVGEPLQYTFRSKTLQRKFIKKIVDFLDPLPNNHRWLILSDRCYLSITYL
jgi:hypothetical protein